ncbi:TPA: hypothetical protein SMI10_001874 [Serratia liquefaciens]|nr:hypothetical protein [Serratia liquefaciens]HEJ7992002.1 hypothetical protein [Serratia liquefaciens]
METRRYSGGCLCGHIRFQAVGLPGNPHSCSCEFCQRHSGAPTLCWVEFPREAVSWIGTGSFDRGELAALRPTAHSFSDGCPDWWKIDDIV